MPGSDASQFISLKKARAVQHGDTQASDPKSVNRLTQYTPQLSAVSNTTKFLPTLFPKQTGPVTRDPINFQSAFGKPTVPHPNASNNF